MISVLMILCRVFAAIEQIFKDNMLSGNSKMSKFIKEIVIPVLIGMALVMLLIAQMTKITNLNIKRQIETDKALCELDLPRTQHCIMKFVPEELEGKTK